MSGHTRQNCLDRRHWYAEPSRNVALACDKPPHVRFLGKKDIKVSPLDPRSRRQRLSKQTCTASRCSRPHRAEEQTATRLHRTTANDPKQTFTSAIGAWMTSPRNVAPLSSAMSASRFVNPSAGPRVQRDIIIQDKTSVLRGCHDVAPFSATA